MHEDERKAMIILHRLASKLKRMVVLATEEGGEGELWDLTKGAPETLKAKMTQESAPASCDEIAFHHMSHGRRVLAMAVLHLLLFPHPHYYNDCSNLLYLLCRRGCLLV
jgi:hypothetical protein